METPKLLPAQEALIERLLEGTPVEDIRTDLGISAKRIVAWMTDQRFLAHLMTAAARIELAHSPFVIAQWRVQAHTDPRFAKLYKEFVENVMQQFLNPQLPAPVPSEEPEPDVNGERLPLDFEALGLDPDEVKDVLPTDS